MKSNWKIIRTKNIVALAAMFLFSACGNQLPTEKHIQSLFHKLPKVKAIISDGHELKVKNTVQSADLETVRYGHFYQGIEVLGSEVRYHQTSSKTESASESLKDVDVITIPTITEDSAKSQCKNSEANSISLKILPGKSSRLVYVVQCSSNEEMWIDAHDGTVLAKVSDSQDANVYSALGSGMVVSYHDDGCELGPINEAKSKFYQNGACAKKSLTYCQLFNTNMEPVGFNPIKCSSAKKNDESAKRAEFHSRRFTEYLKTVHQRNGYDNLGSPIVSIVHAGIKHTNASWYKKGKYIVYGDGDGKEFRDFTLGADIAGHEMTHALIQHTAKLVSFGESGALNEAIADFFGSVIEGQNNWNIGEEIFVDQSNAKALRDLKDPSRLQGQYIQNGRLVNKPMPKHLSEAMTFSGTCDGMNDSCGVHFNATIPGHALYLIHERLGRSASEKLLYEALTHFFNEMTDFKDAAKGILDACALTMSESQCDIVKSAFQDTGILN